MRIASASLPPSMAGKGSLAIHHAWSARSQSPARQRGWEGPRGGGDQTGRRRQGRMGVECDWMVDGEVGWERGGGRCSGRVTGEMVMGVMAGAIG